MLVMTGAALGDGGGKVGDAAIGDGVFADWVTAPPTAGAAVLTGGVFDVGWLVDCR